MHFQDNNMFRSRFSDQLNVNYREWLFKKVDEEYMKEAKSDSFQTAIISTEVDSMQASKDAIKKTYEMKLQRKEKVRRIESTNQRTVHIMFDTGIPNKITPFTRKYKRLLDGNLAEFE